MSTTLPRTSKHVAERMSEMFKREGSYEIILRNVKRSLGGDAITESVATKRGDYYSYRVFSELSRIVESESKLDMSLSYLRRARVSRSAPHKIEQTVAYHVSVFLGQIGTVRDLLRHMTNEVFNLGIHHRDCSLSLLKRHSHLKDHAVLNSLDEVEKFLGTSIKMRNQMVHRAGHSDFTSFFEDDTWDFVRMLSLASTWDPGEDAVFQIETTELTVPAYQDGLIDTLTWCKELREGLVDVASRLDEQLATAFLAKSI